MVKEKLETGTVILPGQLEQQGSAKRVGQPGSSYAETFIESPKEKKRKERERVLSDISGLVEKSRKAGFVGNESANLVADALTLEGDEALFANRIVSRGSDPASLELALTGKISEPIMRAHRLGPGSLKEEERERWLILASVSLDEHSEAELPPTRKFAQFNEALNWLKSATDEEKKEAAEEELRKILALPFEDGEVGGIKMRIYNSDKGFASAYWSGQEFAAVKEGQTTFVGSQGRTLDEIGVKVNKQLSPTFGIIFESSTEN